MNPSIDKIIIGLTGGIATGKTTVTNYLENKYKIPVIDADILAKKAVNKNSPIYNQIVTKYGQNILDKHDELNRQKLGDIIFSNEKEKIWLEKQIHPYVRKEIEKIINQLDYPIIVLSIPLLFEAKMTDLVTTIWVVYCDFETQLYRLQIRNELDRDSAIARIKSQMPLAEKIKKGDLILNNNNNIENLYQEIDREITLINKKTT